MLDSYSKIQPAVRKEIETSLDNYFKNKQKEQQYQLSRIQSHAHTGKDSLPVNFSSIAGKTFIISWTLPGASAATAGNYSTIFIAPFECVLIGMTKVQAAAGTDPGDVTLQIERLQGTEAPGAGDALLSSALSLKSTANTVQTGSIVPTRTNGVLLANLSENDRIALKLSGTPTAVANLTVTLLFQIL